MQRNTQFKDDVESAVDEIISQIGKDIRVGMPLGLAKPNQLINALYARAKADSEIQLTILTALSLEKPGWSSDIERRFLEPFLNRVFGDCPALDYAVDVTKRQLPDNVTVKEFFYRPGSRINNPQAQYHYISSNYTHAARDVFANGCNVTMQIVAKKVVDGKTKISMSCNPDTGPELIELLEAAGRKHVVVGMVNQRLPYMVHDAEFETTDFDILVDHEQYYTQLFGTPKTPVTTPDYMIGLNASALLCDGGTIQVGIGALGDAIVYGAIQRHEQNAAYNDILRDVGIAENARDIIAEAGGTETFKQGLYGATEMFVDGFLHLYQHGILKRKVYDFWALQQALNDGICDPDNIQPTVLDAMEAKGVRVIRTQDFEKLQYHGLFSDDCGYENGHVIAPDGEKIIANLGDPAARNAMAAKCLGTQLKNGIVLHGGFFLGPNDFYQSLNDMSDEERAQICMTGVYKVNQLDHNPRLYKAQRRDARFINTGLMATMSGAVVSDGLENGQVVSGVGGQYNFVAMAHHLQTGRSILMVRSVREKDGEAVSNIVWNYGHCTIPRHLRDIVITEYGIAVLRSKSDSEIIQALLNITDSRFQQTLLDTAKQAGKIAPDYKIPEQFQNNTPQRLDKALKPHKQNGLFPVFPFGTDFTDEEWALAKALKGVKARTAGKKIPFGAIWDARKVKTVPVAAKPYIERMDLMNPANLQEKLVQKLLVLELQAAGKV